MNPKILSKHYTDLLDYHLNNCTPLYGNDFYYDKFKDLDKYKYMKYYPVEENVVAVIIDFWSGVIRVCVKVVQKAIKLIKK